jgi:hypothetical protein
MYVGGSQVVQVHVYVTMLMYEFQCLFQSIVDYIQVWSLY